MIFSTEDLTLLLNIMIKRNKLKEIIEGLSVASFESEKKHNLQLLKEIKKVIPNLSLPNLIDWTTLINNQITKLKEA